MEKSDAPSRVPWPPLMFAASLLAGIVGHFLWPVRVWPGGPAWIGGVVLVMVAVAIALSASRQLRIAHTTIRPHEAATALVTSGPFAYSRNPLYVALCLLSLATALLLNGIVPIITTLLLWTGLNSGVIPREEQHLAARFPQQFAEYRQRVRRWL